MAASFAHFFVSQKYDTKNHSTFLSHNTEQMIEAKKKHEEQIYIWKQLESTVTIRDIQSWCLLVALLSFSLNTKKDTTNKQKSIKQNWSEFHRLTFK